MRLANGMRGGLLAAAFLTTLLAGAAGAAAPDPARYEAATKARIDPKGASHLPAKSGSGAWSLSRAATPQAATSNQYPPEMEPNDTPAGAAAEPAPVPGPAAPGLLLLGLGLAFAGLRRAVQARR